MHVVNNKERNIENAVRLIRKCVKDFNPKLVVLPENFNMLYGTRVLESAEIIPTGETSVTLATLARELKIYLVCGSIIERCETNTTLLYNTSMVYSPMGVLIAKHRKIHLTDIDIVTDVRIRELDYVKAGNKLTTFDVDGIKVGLGIGFDLSFGELATLYRKDGCDLLIYPIVYPVGLGNVQEHLLRTRAIDNQLYVVGVSQARDDTHELVSYGHTIVVDPKGLVLTRGFDREDILFTQLG